jgi:hypothetical protein
MIGGDVLTRHARWLMSHAWRASARACELEPVRGEKCSDGERNSKGAPRRIGRREHGHYTTALSCGIDRPVAEGARSCWQRLGGDGRFAAGPPGASVLVVVAHYVVGPLSLQELGWQTNADSCWCVLGTRAQADEVILPARQ